MQRENGKDDRNEREDENGGSRVRQATITSDTRVTLNFVWSVIAILGPLASMLFLQYQSIQSLKGKIDGIAGSMQALQIQVGDRWTRSMMVLFATELELRNKFSSNGLIVPNPEEIARRIPPEYKSPLVFP